jgi:hypothetical protein
MIGCALRECDGAWQARSAGLVRGGIARCQHGAGGGRELTDELLDEVLLVHADKVRSSLAGE